MKNCLVSQVKRLGLSLALAGGIASSAFAADHRDGPIFPNAGNGNLDINDIYVFKSPANAKNTVLAFTTHPFAGVFSPTTFNPLLNFDIKVDNNGNASEDITYRVNFSNPGTGGVQQVTVRRILAVRRPGCANFESRGAIIGTGQTGQNIQLRGGGTFRAGIFDDPFFFDVNGFNRLVGSNPQITGPNAGQIAPGDGNSFQNPGKNFFGPSVNTLAMVFEVPTKSLVRGKKTNIGVFVRVGNVSDNGQVDRMGFPAINTALIPPVPRTDLSRGDRRTAFNVGHPKNDVRDFSDDMLFVLTNPNGIFKRTTADASGIVDLLLPDLLPYDSASDAGFPNGRKLTDDVIDIELKLLTGVDAATDNVASDSNFLTTFPYLAPANDPGCGLNNTGGPAPCPQS